MSNLLTVYKLENQQKKRFQKLLKPSEKAEHRLQAYLNSKKPVRRPRFVMIRSAGWVIQRLWLWIIRRVHRTLDRGFRQLSARIRICAIIDQVPQETEGATPNITK